MEKTIKSLLNIKPAIVRQLLFAWSFCRTCIDSSTVQDSTNKGKDAEYCFADTYAGLLWIPLCLQLPKKNHSIDLFDFEEFFWFRKKIISVVVFYWKMLLWVVTRISKLLLWVVVQKLKCLPRVPHMF
jgi:hypothetical protein